MDDYKWLAFKPLSGMEQKINEEYSYLMADPGVFLVATPEILETNPSPSGVSGLQMFPLHLIEQGDLSNITDLLCIVMVLMKHPKWFLHIQNLQDAQRLLFKHGYLLKLKEPGCHTALLIKSEYIEVANAESLYF